MPHRENQPRSEASTELSREMGEGFQLCLHPGSSHAEVHVTPRLQLQRPMNCLPLKSVVKHRFCPPQSTEASCQDRHRGATSPRPPDFRGSCAPPPAVQRTVFPVTSQAFVPGRSYKPTPPHPPRPSARRRGTTGHCEKVIRALGNSGRNTQEA